jgi:trk system potassium uptake protein TrkA
MKYLIIGLGNFGKTLAEELTDKGHEVIGVDANEHRVDEVKERISVAYIMNATEPQVLKALPLDEMDCAIVAVGRDMEHSLRVVAALKELKVPRIYARAIDSVHMSILRGMNIQKIFMPECYAARLFAGKLSEKVSGDMV